MTKFRSIEGVDRCPHCSVATPLFVIPWTGQTPTSVGPPQHWALAACVRCGKCLAVGSWPHFDVDFSRPFEIYPTPKQAHQDIPEMARVYLQQAYDTLHSPDAASLMAGSAVDAMLKSLNYKDGSVYKRIDQALADNVITKGMADWAHVVRLGANRPRHADIESPYTTPEEAENSVQFAEALANFLFVLSARIDRGISAAADN